jgi:hypothetical protein
LVVGGGQGDDVPGVGGDYIGGDEVDAGGGVGDSVGGDVAFVGVAALVQSAFDLDAGEMSVVVDGEVVGDVVAPGLVDVESVLGGAGQETEFGPLAAGFGLLNVDASIGDGLSWGWWILRNKNAALGEAAS